uniref:G_PROTEIN_RECEP_F1_2 domain-containing protein n=1 Tax=Rhabditophanes sp. KR3021 TaxID=114890 RepID=A0AC35UFZ7_9BILA
MFSELVDPYLTAEALSKAFIIFIVWIVLVVSACLCIRTIWAREELQDAVGSYLLALSFSDLVYGFTIVPMAFYSSLTPDWNFYGDNSLTCKVAGYLQIVLFSFNFYIFAWIAVNRYTALYRPSRYDAEQTKTRSKCWIAFSLITSSFMACPIVIANMEVAYFSEAELCVLRWSKTKTLAYNFVQACSMLRNLCFFRMYSIAYVTVPSQEVAKSISRSIVESKLAACVNIVPGIVSVYHWEGKINEDNELLLIIKTTSINISKLQQKILELHPYDTPEFIHFPIEGGSDKYLQWLTDQTTK